MSRYRCVDDQKAVRFPVAGACQVAGALLTSACSAWAAKAARGPSQREQDQRALIAEVCTIHIDSNGTSGSGSPKVTAELTRRGRPVNHKRVERPICDHHLVGRLFGPNNPGYLRRRHHPHLIDECRVPGQHDRPGLPPAARLLDGLSHACRTRHGRARTIRRHTWQAANGRHGLPLRPRLPFHSQRFRASTTAANGPRGKTHGISCTKHPAARGARR
jgi:HTH-like domain